MRVKKLYGLFEKFPKVQLEKRKGGMPPQDAEYQNYLILDRYYIYFWRLCPCAQVRVGFILCMHFHIGSGQCIVTANFHLL